MSKTKKFNIIILVLTNILFISLTMWIDIVFATPDDFIYTLILSGNYTGSPSAFMVFSNFIYGSIISSLYSLFPSIEWYSWIQYALSLISFNVFMLLILKEQLCRELKGICILTLFVLQLYITISPNFTITASELSLASALLIFTKKINKRKIFVAILLFFVASLIRWNAALIPYMILTPLFVLPINLRQIYYLKRILVSFFLIILTGFLVYINHKAYYQDTSWAQYMEYNGLRGHINDNPSIKKGIEVIQDPIKKCEYKLMTEHWISDGNILSTEDLTKIVEHLKTMQIDNIKINIITLWNKYRFLLFFVLGLFVMTLYYLIRKHYNTQIIIFCCCTALFIIANSYAIAGSMVKERIVISTVCTYLFICYFFLYNKLSTSVLSLSLFLLVGFFGVKIHHLILRNKEEIKKTEQVEQLVNRCNYNKIVFHNQVPISPNVFKISKFNISKKLVRIGWPNNCPLTEKYFNGFVFYTKGLPFIANKRNLNDELKLIIYILKEHYHKDVRPIILLEDLNYAIVKLKVL